MSDTAVLLTTLGVLLLAGLATDAVGRYTRLPRVSLLLVLGVAAGPAGFDALPSPDSQLFSLATYTALAMVGFLLGERFTPAALREQGRSIAIISIAAVLLTALCVSALLLLFGVPADLALLLGAIATSTDPAATADVVEQHGKDGPFGRLLLGIVAIDDAWGLVFFAFVAAGVGMVASGGSPAGTVLMGLREVGGALALGGILGVPVALLTARLRPGEPTLLEALGSVFLCSGLALYLGVSPLLAAMAMGTCVANVARHHERPFHAIRDVERPFLVVFFILAGAMLDFSALSGIGLVGLGYIIARVAGRLVGGFVGGILAGEDHTVARWLGLALVPQAGVALGLAVAAAERFPSLLDEIVPIVVGATVLFEVFGPLGTRAALRAAS